MSINWTIPLKQFIIGTIYNILNYNEYWFSHLEVGSLVFDDSECTNSIYNLLIPIFNDIYKSIIC